MAKKLSLDDLKVQSFVTSLTRSEAVEAQGGATLLCTNTRRSGCCEGSYYPCTTGTTDCYTVYGATSPECGGCAPTDPNYCATDPSTDCPTTGYYQCASDPNFGCSIDAC